MENLSKTQKIILISIAILMLLVIGYYFMQKTKQYDNYEMSDMVKNNEDNRNTNSQIDSEKMIVIHITGEVYEEGIVFVPEDSRIIDVISKAGGTKVDVDLSKVNLAYMVSDGQKIYIPSIHDSDERKRSY